MAQRTPLSETISAFSLIIAMLATELEKSAAMSRRDFAKKLKESVDAAEADAPEHLKGQPRLDLKIARKVVRLLSLTKPPDPNRAWLPIVIEGGRREPDQD